MIAIPVVDLREGACVQLIGGAFDAERVRLEDPVAVARNFVHQGFARLHVVDLDAALGRGSNEHVVREILREVDVEVQVGGGVRTEERIERLLADGAARVVIGTRAFEDWWWLEEMTGKFADTIIVAADVYARRVVTRGWTHVTARSVLDAVDDLNALDVAGILVTAIHRGGTMQGADLPLMEDVAAQSESPVYAGGGIGTIGDLRDLADRGVAACVIGMALYTGAVDPRLVVEEFGE